VYQWWQKKSTTTRFGGKSKTNQQPPASASNQILPQSSESKQLSFRQEDALEEMQVEDPTARKSWWPFS
jgi:hypothetical protein